MFPQKLWNHQILREYSKSKEKRNEKDRQHRKNIFGSAEHEQIKKVKRAAYAKRFGTQKHNLRKKQMRCDKRNARSIKKQAKNLNKVKLFKDTVQLGPRYDPVLLECVVNVLSYDRRSYICKTCDKQLRKKKIPCQSVSNKLENIELPNGLSNINRLERVLVAKRLLFKKITIMPKGQSPKLKGNI